MWRNSTGFTILEFLVAVVILTVGLLGLLRTVALSVDHNLGNERRNHAAQVADELMVLENARPFASLSAMSTRYLSGKMAFRSGYVHYSVSRMVTPVGASSAATRIVLSWKHKGKRCEHEISSIRSAGR